ncbi:MAG: CRISPR-associated protein Cas4 [Spirochaetales bacterium]|nr:CRISPR-associated protein Cas4 [Spirochaetales bacterium]
MDTEVKLSITPSTVLEYLYCPRFIYFMEVLDIPQNEETRYKVMEGRNVHKIKALSNAEYKRKKINVIKKEINQEMYSNTYNIHGIVDEILFISDGTAAPLDYKFAQFKDKIFKTYRIQSAMYALMIKDNYGVQVNKGYLVYTRSKNHVEELIFTDDDFNSVKEIVQNIIDIVTKNIFPKRTRVRIRCSDCCYRNICIK